MDQFRFFRLEDRTVFDATLPVLLDIDSQSDVAFVGGDGFAADHLESALASIEAGLESRGSPGKEIAFIDSSLPDMVELLAGISPGTEVVFIEPDQDGLQLMRDVLSGRSDYDAIHVIGHGDSGLISLGSTALTQATIADYGDELGQIGSALTLDGDILFYGCNVADTQSGEWLVERIAELSGADVAASDDLTGAAELGGDWDLEFSVGDIEANAINADSWQHILHTNSVGFDIVNNSGTLTLNFFYGSWHSNPNAEGALSLYTLKSGGDRDNYADYTVEAYGNGGARADQTIPFQTVESGSSGATVGNITFAGRYDSNGFTNTELDTAGFDLGTTYYFADNSKLYGYRNSSDSSSFTSADTTGNGIYRGSQVYKHQWATIVGIQAGTYTAYYDDNPVGETRASSLSFNWSPQTAIRQMIFTIASDGTISLGSSTAVTKSGLEDNNITFADSDFTDAFSGTLGDIKIKSLPTSGTLQVSGANVTVNQELDATDRGNLVYVPDADSNGSDTFNWEAYDAGASAYVGEDTKVNITVTAVNDEPGLTATAADPTFSEGDADGVALFTDATFDTSPDSAQNISEITFTVSGLVDGTNERLRIGGSEFALVNTASVSAPADANAGTPAFSFAATSNGGSITLSGSWSVAQAKALLESIKYKNYSDDVDGTRTFTLTEIKDAGGTANSGDDTKTLSIASDVTLNGINDEPTLTAQALDPTYTENQSAVAVFTNAAASTIESGQTFAGLTLTVSNLSDGAAEKLTIDGKELDLVDDGGTTVTTVTNTLTAAVSVTGSTATVTLTGGMVSADDFQTLINSILYRNSDEDPTDGVRTVTITSVTDSGSGTGSNDNTTTLTIASDVDVDPVNDLPTLTLPSSAWQTEKASTNDTGRITLSGLSVSDPDEAGDISLVLALDDGSDGSGDYGKLTMIGSAPAGLQVDNDGTDTVTLTGTVSEINDLLLNGIYYDALSGQDVVDDGKVNTLTATLTDNDSGSSVSTKTITVMPARPNAQSVNLFAVEDTNKVDIQNLDTVVDVPGAAVDAGGLFAFSDSGTVDWLETFSGDGSTVFTLSQSPDNDADIDVYVGGTKQVLGTIYTVSGADITFLAGKVPASGTDNIVVQSNTGTLGAVAAEKIVDHPTIGSSVKGLDLGNGVLYLQENQTFSGDGSTKTFTLTDALFASEAAADLTVFIVASDGTQTAVASSDFSVSGLALTLGADVTAPANGATLVVRGGPTGNIQSFDGVSGVDPGGALMFVPDAGYAGTEEFFYQYSRSGKTSPVARALIYVEGVNDAPTIDVSGAGAKSVNEEAALTFSSSDIELSDADIGSGTMELTLSVESGTLTLGDATPNDTPVVFAAGADGSSYMKIRATEADLETALDGLKYVGNTNFTGGDTLTVNLSDLGNSGTGGALPATQQTVAITVNNVNDTPSLSATMLGTSGAGNAVSFTENGVPSLLFSDAALSDVEGDKISELVVEVKNLADGADEKLVIDGAIVTLQNGTTGISSVLMSDSGTTATITITPSSPLSLAAANTLINGIRYLNTSGDATEAAREVTLKTITDDGGDGANATRTLTGLTSYVGVSPVNTEPTLSATGGSMIEFNENATAASLFSSADASPIETGQGFLSLEFTVTNVDDTGYEAVTVDGTEFLLDDLVTGSTADNGYTYSVSVTGTTATVTVSGAIAETDYEALIDGIKYRHTGDNPTVSNHRVVAITSVQDDGGSDDGGDDTLAVTGISRMVMITASNDAPTGVGSLSDLTKTVGESTTVATASAFSDVEGDTLTYTMQGAPRGLVINASTGVISGAPLRAGTFTVTVTATDPGSASAQQTFTITVAASGEAKVSKGEGNGRGRGPVGDIFTPEVTAPNAQSTLSSSGAVARSVVAPALSVVGGGGTGPALDAARAVTRETGSMSFTATDRMVANPVSQTVAAPGQTGSFALPRDTFVSPSTPSSELAITATLEDGSPLPDWIEFDPQQQTFEFTPPPEVRGLIGLVIRAVDSDGREAVTTGSILVGDGQEDELLSPSQSPADDQQSPGDDADGEANVPEPDDGAMLDWDELERVYATASVGDLARPGTPWLHAALS